MSGSFLLQPLLEEICAKFRLSFFFKPGEYISVEDVYRVLQPCSNTPDLLFKRLVDDGVLSFTDKRGVVQLH